MSERDDVTHEELGNVRERVASTEAKLDSMKSTQERLVEGQGEILSQLESMNAATLDREKFNREYRPQIKKNSRHRTVAKGFVGLGSLMASFLSLSVIGI